MKPEQIVLAKKLRELAEAGDVDALQATIRQIEPQIFEQLMATQNTHKQMLLIEIGELLLKKESSVNAFMALFASISPALISKALTSGRPICLLEKIISRQQWISPMMKDRMLQMIDPKDLDDAVMNTEILPLMDGIYLDFINKVSGPALEKALTAISNKKSSRVLGNDLGAPDIVRVVELEKCSLDMLKLFYARNVSLEIIYKNLFCIDRGKLSSAFYHSFEVPGLGPLFGIAMLPFTATLSVVEAVSRGNGISWESVPRMPLRNNHSHDFWLLLLGEMELAWLHGNTSFDMGKVLQFKIQMTPTSEKAKQQQQAIYKSFLDCAMNQGALTQKATKHLFVAASRGIMPAQAALQELHANDVIQLQQQFGQAKERLAALTTLQFWGQLGDKNALSALISFYDKKWRSDELHKISDNELSLLEKLDASPQAAVYLGRYYEARYKAVMNYSDREKAIEYYNKYSDAESLCEVARVTCEGLLVKRDVKSGLIKYFHSAIGGCEQAKVALYQHAIDEKSEIEASVFAKIILLLSGTDKYVDEFSVLVQKSPEIVIKILCDNAYISKLYLHSWKEDAREFNAKLKNNLLLLLKQYCESTPEKSGYYFDMAKSHAERLIQSGAKIKNQTVASNCNAATSATIPKSHQNYLEFNPKNREQLQHYKGEIPEDLQNISHEIMENPWVCNDGNTYCMIADLPKLLGKPAPNDASITLQAIAPNAKVRKACLEFVERAKDPAVAVSASSSSTASSKLVDSFKNAETVPLLFPSAPVDEPAREIATTSIVRATSGSDVSSEPAVMLRAEPM